MRVLSHLPRALLLAFALTHAEVRAEDADDGQLPERVQRMSDAEVSRRLDFLVGHLDEGRDYAWWWWNGWTAFYGLGAVIQATRAGLTDHNARQAEYVISAVKATGGVITLLLRPLEAKDGADTVRAIALDPELAADPAELRRHQLVVAENTLHTNAEVSLRRYNWLRHILNVAVNAAGAIILWQAYDDPSRAARSGGIGTAVGEVSFWTQPWWPADDWEEYQRRFNDRTDSNVRFHVGPTVGGLAFRVDF